VLDRLFLAGPDARQFCLCPSPMPTNRPDARRGLWRRVQGDWSDGRPEKHRLHQRPSQLRRNVPALDEVDDQATIPCCLNSLDFSQPAREPESFEVCELLGNTMARSTIAIVNFISENPFFPRRLRRLLLPRLQLRPPCPLSQSGIAHDRGSQCPAPCRSRVAACCGPLNWNVGMPVSS
jgi:hypothetical protein